MLEAVERSGTGTATPYSEITRLIERLHRRYLDVLRIELSRLAVDDINAVQALLLLNLRSDEVTIRELVDRGYYVGSNVTYNVKQLVEAGYVDQQRSERDKRSIKIRTTEKGNALCERLADMESRHSESLQRQSNGTDYDSVRALMRSLERVWSDDIQYGP